MVSRRTSNKAPVGVIGAGSFGTAVANLLALNQPVVFYARKQEVVDAIIHTRKHLDRDIHRGIHPTTSLQEVAEKCTLIFPTLPSSAFREMVRELGPHLRPDHILIHGTKGLDLKAPREMLDKPNYKFSRADIATMSEVITEESIVLRVGAMAGPNLAGELAQGKPAATVIASHFDEVIEAGRRALRSPQFQVYGNHDLTGVELSGVLKNALAIGSGILGGLDLGENARALLITKGLSELVRLGQALGSDATAFLGLAGIGDLIATCTSSLSRNYTVGYRLGKGETLDHILATSTEVAEGVNTIRLARHLGRDYDVKLPILNILYSVLFEQMAPQDGLQRLMLFPYAKDVDFIN